jgi:hypothetical protein
MDQGRQAPWRCRGRDKAAPRYDGLTICPARRGGTGRQPARPARARPGAAARKRRRLDAGTLQIEATRVVVDGKVIESDGKTENAQHLLALDPFTPAVLKSHVDMLDQERVDFGPDYLDHGVLFAGRTASRRIPTRSPADSSD